MILTEDGEVYSLMCDEPRPRKRYPQLGQGRADPTRTIVTASASTAEEEAEAAATPPASVATEPSVLSAASRCAHFAKAAGVGGAADA